MATKLEKLLQKEAQLKAQIQQAKAAERTLEKKRDTRRKILVGAAVLTRVERGEWPEADLKRMMDGFLTRQNERDLFKLDALPDDAGTESGTKAKSAKAQTASKGDKPSVGKYSTARKKATKEKLRRQREEAAKAADDQKASGSSTGLAEPDFDVDKEFNL